MGYHNYGNFLNLLEGENSMKILFFYTSLITYFLYCVLSIMVLIILYLKSTLEGIEKLNCFSNHIDKNYPNTTI